MTKSQRKPEEFLNFNIGEIQPKNKTFIPDKDELAYAPKGASLEEINKRRDVLRDYYKRNLQVYAANNTGGGPDVVYSVPTGYTLFIETISVSLYSGGPVNIYTGNVYIRNGTLIIKQVNCRVLTANQASNVTDSTTYNNPIIVYPNDSVTITTTANSGFTCVISGWLEDNPE